MKIEQLLARVVQENASDGFVTAGAAPCIKVDGQLHPITDHVLSGEQVDQLVMSTMNEKQRAEFLATNEANFAISHERLGRFRVSVFRQRGSAGLVLRRIKTEIPAIEDLGLPPDHQRPGDDPARAGHYGRGDGYR